jgi:hypothetical protein
MAEIVHGILIRLRGRESSAKALADATDRVRVLRSRSTHQTIRVGSNQKGDHVNAATAAQYPFRSRRQQARVSPQLKRDQP